MVESGSNDEEDGDCDDENNVVSKEEWDTGSEDVEEDNRDAVHLFDGSAELVVVNAVSGPGLASFAAVCFDLVVARLYSPKMAQFACSLGWLDSICRG